MTITFKNANIGKYDISINQDKYCKAYYVTICEFTHGVYHERRKNYYATEKQAKQRFNYLVRQAKKGTL